MKQFIIKQPKRVFLIDAIGAFLSFSVLAFVFYSFNDLFLLPCFESKLLMFVAASVFLYSFLVYCFVQRRVKLFLIILLFFNIAYCVSLLLVLFSSYGYITNLGVAYLIVETIILVAVVFFEYYVYRNLIGFT